MRDRVAVITEHIDVASMKGLEIGALNHPTFAPGQADIRYLDHLSTPDLRAKYAQDATSDDVVANMVEVDFVWSPGLRLREAVGAWAPLDFVIASHVVEHVANPVGWLGQIAEILTEGGILTLAVPDKRFCFDAKRPASTLGQIVDADLRELDVTTYQQIFDFSANYLVDADASRLWSGLDPQEIARTDIADPALYAYRICVEQKRTGTYVDVHANTFTPRSMVDILAGLGRMGRLRFAVADFWPTERPSLEFHLTLRRLPDTLDDAERLRRQDAGIALCRERLRGADQLSAAAADGFVVSPKERELLLRKRAALLRGRHGVAALRRLARRP